MAHRAACNRLRRALRHAGAGALESAYTINKDGSVSIEAPDGPHTLPSYMVLKGPNPTGHAVWWYLDLNGRHSDYCFAPGTLT